MTSCSYTTPAGLRLTDRGNAIPGSTKATAHFEWVVPNNLKGGVKTVVHSNALFGEMVDFTSGNVQLTVKAKYRKFEYATRYCNDQLPVRTCDQCTPPAVLNCLIEVLRDYPQIRCVSCSQIGSLLASTTKFPLCTVGDLSDENLHVVTLSSRNVSNAFMRPLSRIGQAYKPPLFLEFLSRSPLNATTEQLRSKTEECYSNCKRDEVCRMPCRYFSAELKIDGKKGER